MEKKFTSDEVPLSQILREAQIGKLQLPDFQRGWVWDDGHISSLLASISMSYPIGAVMTLQTGNPEVKFRPRFIQGVALTQAIEPEVLLLDGQQRITSLYLALQSRKPVETRDAKGNDLLRRYYADIQKCLDPHEDREEAIFGVPADGVIKVFGGDNRLDISTRALEIEQLMFPLDIIMDASDTMNWMLEYLANGPGLANERIEIWKQFNERVVNAFVQYQIPTIQLIKSTPKEAVCQVFEKVNTGGVPLTVFELLTATYAADDFNLRDDWAKRQDRLKQYDVLARFEATDFLQILTLLATRERRLASLANEASTDRVPPISCKRRDILRLELSDYQKWADVATTAVERLVPFLHSEHIFDARDLPYATQIVPLGAIFSVLGPRAEGHGVRKRLRQWYWCGVFGEMYGGATETRFALDVHDVLSWLAGDENEPRTVKEAQFQAARLLTLRSRISAAYKGLFALQMKRGGRDFRTGNAIDVHAYIDDAIDIHHIFPKKWCESNGYGVAVMDSVINKTAIDSKTNGIIGGRAPSAYLEKIQTTEEIDAADLDAILLSHDIDPISLRQDDFASFFNHRFERLLKQIEEAMGKPANRSPEHDESPFRDADREAQRLTDNVTALIISKESKVVEFKSTGRKSLHTGLKDPGVEWAVVKTVAGFMNSNGGTLLVGVADDGSLVGIDEDYQFLNKQDEDGWQLWLTDLISTTLGKVAAWELSVGICELQGKHIASIRVGPAADPVFARQPKSDKGDVFYARINNSTQELAGQQLLSFQKNRWPH